jgi:hypothetical protein
VIEDLLIFLIQFCPSFPFEKDKKRRLGISLSYKRYKLWTQLLDDHTWIELYVYLSSDHY